MRSSFAHLVFAVLILVLVSFLYGWWYYEVTLESAEAVSLADDIALRLESAKRTSSLEAVLARVQSSQGEVQGYFVSENNIVAFLENLEKIGPTIGSKVRVVSVGAPTTKTVDSLLVSVTVDGSFDSVMRTIGAIESAPYAIVTSSVTITKSATGWNAGVTMSVGSTISPPGSSKTSTTSPTNQSISPKSDI